MSPSHSKCPSYPSILTSWITHLHDYQHLTTHTTQLHGAVGCALILSAQILRCNSPAPSTCRAASSPSPSWQRWKHHYDVTKLQKSVMMNPLSHDELHHLRQLTPSKCITPLNIWSIYLDFVENSMLIFIHLVLSCMQSTKGSEDILS